MTSPAQPDLESSRTESQDEDSTYPYNNPLTLELEYRSWARREAPRWSTIRAETGRQVPVPSPASADPLAGAPPPDELKKFPCPATAQDILDFRVRILEDQVAYWKSECEKEKAWNKVIERNFDRVEKESNFEIIERLRIEERKDEAEKKVTQLRRLVEKFTKDADAIFP
jgi:hypothetical protein